MKSRVYIPIIILALWLSSAVPTFVQAQQASQGAISALTALPASDLVMHFDLQRILNDAVPRVLSSAPTTLAQVNAVIDKFKTQTGIDARSFEHVAVGMRMTDPAKATEKDAVIIAHGSFDAGALIAAGRLAAEGRYQEQKYGEKTIYLFKMPASATPLRTRTQSSAATAPADTEIAVAALNPRTLAFAINNPANVRAAIDASEGRSRVDAKLINLVMRNPNALISMSGTIPASATQNFNIGNQEITKLVSSIRQFYGSVGTTTNGFDMIIAALTETSDQAQKLSETLSAMKQLAPTFIGGAPAEIGGILRNVLNSLTLNTQGNELQLRAELTQPDINTLVRLLNQSRPKQPAKEPAKEPTRRRSRRAKGRTR